MSQLLYSSYPRLASICDKLGVLSGGETARALVDMMAGSVQQIKSGFQEDSLSTFGDHYYSEVKKR